MPVIHVFHSSEGLVVRDILRVACDDVARAIEAPSGNVWGLWHHVDREMAHRPDWDDDPGRGPIVRVFCRRSHPAARAQAMVRALRKSLGDALGCATTSIFVQIIRVDDEEVFSVS
jgi:hypothetical protein